MVLKQNRLEEGYYLNNFLSLIDFVRKQYADILTEEEQLFIQEFKKLSKDSARLYVRLISRTAPIFRIDKLNYSEIKSLENASRDLAQAGFMVVDGDWELEDLLRLFTKPELITFLKTQSSDAKTSWARARATEEVESFYETEFYEWVSKDHCTLYPMGSEIVLLFKLLFFGNLEQNLSEFVLEDIGVLRFENYRLTKKNRFFADRKTIDETYKLIELQMELYFAREEVEEDLVEELMKKVIKIKSSSLLRKKEKLCRMAGQFFEKQKDYERALFYYKKSSTPPSRERAVRVLEKLDEDLKALNYCKKIAKSPIDDSEREFISHFPEKLKRKLGREHKKLERESFYTEEFKVPNPKGKKIEPWTLHHLEKTGVKGFYVENYLWTSIFGLIFWDIIFKSKPGAFYNPFQRGPNDLYSEDFYLSREKEINKRLKWIGSEGWIEEVLQTYKEKNLTANYLVRWKQIKLGAVKKVINKVPSQHIALVMKRMSRSLRHHSAGFPDLFIYHPRKKDYCLVEVKGPGDQLQQSQKRWLRYFYENEIPCKVLKVTY